MNQKQPDALAKSASHALVGIAAAIVSGYALVNLLGVRKNSGLYIAIAAVGAMWIHTAYDLPVARTLTGLGL